MYPKKIKRHHLNNLEAALLCFLIAAGPASPSRAASLVETGLPMQTAEAEPAPLPEHTPPVQPAPKGTVALEPKIVAIPGGCVDMDSSTSGQERATEDQPKQVCVQEFALGKYEVTQAQWQAVMGSNPSAFAGCDDCPVERVSWNDAQDYIRKLNAKTGKHYRLPSDAEWEIACRAGEEHEYCGADEIETVAWHYGNAEHHTQPVGSKQPNAWGLHDMSGNVWEWTQDCHEGDCTMHMLRGGSWGNVERSVHAAFRNREAVTTRSEFVGLRLAR